MAAGGLYLLSQSFENNGAKAIINNEFKIPNQVTGTSALVDENSLLILYMTNPHIIIKLDQEKYSKVKFDQMFF